MDIFYIFLKFLGCSRADLEKDASAARWKFSESEEILGGNHGKLSYFPGFTKQNYLVIKRKKTEKGRVPFF